MRPIAKFLFLTLLFIPAFFQAKAADIKISNLPVATVVHDSDVFYYVDKSGVSPVSKQLSSLVYKKYVFAGVSGDGTINESGVLSLSTINATDIANGSVNNTEFQYLSNVTEDIQTQFGTKQAAIQFKDEGSNIGGNGTVNGVNYTGAGVTASETGGVVTVNIPGSGSSGGGSTLDYVDVTDDAVIPDSGISRGTLPDPYDYYGDSVDDLALSAGGIVNAVVRGNMWLYQDNGPVTNRVVLGGGSSLPAAVEGSVVITGESDTAASTTVRVTGAGVTGLVHLTQKVKGTGQDPDEPNNPDNDITNFTAGVPLTGNEVYNGYIGVYAALDGNDAVMTVQRRNSSYNPGLTFYNVGNKGFKFQSANTTVDLFRLTHTTNGVNYIDLSPGITGVGALFEAKSGTDTNADINFKAKGTGSVNIKGTATSQGKLAVYEDTDNGTNKLTITPPASISADADVVLPAAGGTLCTLAGSESLTNKKLGSLTTNGFVKTGSGDGTLSVDTTSYQTLDPTLTAMAGVSSSADKFIYFNGVDTATSATCTAAARTILDDATVDDIITTLGGAAYTGTSGIVRKTSPTLTTPILGTATATKITASDGGDEENPIFTWESGVSGIYGSDSKVGLTTLDGLSYVELKNASFDIAQLNTINFESADASDGLEFNFYADGAATNEKNWQIGTGGGQFWIAVSNDAGSTTNYPLYFDQTGVDVNEIVLEPKTGGNTKIAAGTFQTAAGRIKKTRVITAAGAVTVTNADEIIILNKTSGAATAVNLPAGVTGAVYTIKDGKGDAASNNITITPAAGNIDGSATYVLTANYGQATVVYNGTQWNVIEK